MKTKLHSLPLKEVC